MAPLLEITDLRTEIRLKQATVHAVDGASIVTTIVWSAFAAVTWTSTRLVPLASDPSNLSPSAGDAAAVSRWWISLPLSHVRQAPLLLPRN